MNAYIEWRENNKYCGKKFSILGDSISTLNGYNPRGYKVFYDEDNCKRANIEEYTDTWWGEVIKFFGADLLVNNSWSGSRVTKPQIQEELFPSGCSDERTSSLHINSVKPDVIIIYLGTNDWAFGAETGEEIRLLDCDENELFEDAYRMMLKKIKINYPESEVWCCTLSETFISNKPDFSFPHKYAGIHIEDYNEIIRRTVRETDCKLIDLYHMKMPYDSIDGSHPNRNGMKTIAASVCYSMADDAGRKFLKLNEGLRYKLIGDKYWLQEIIGMGGMTKVYLAIDALGKQYAIKCILKSAIDQNTIGEALLSEVKILKKLDYPYIRKAIGQIEDDTYIYIVLEYVEGTDLETLASKAGGILPKEKVIRYTLQIAEALQYIHSLNPPIINRNIKPRNILIDINDNVKLVNFGIAMEYNPNAADICALGTKGYAAPEQYTGRTTPKSDIFALGMLMHQLLTGVNPIKPPYEINLIRQYDPTYSKELERIVEKCTRSNPDERYSSCLELINALSKESSKANKIGVLKKLGLKIKKFSS